MRKLNIIKKKKAGLAEEIKKLGISQNEIKELGNFKKGYLKAKGEYKRALKESEKIPFPDDYDTNDESAEAYEEAVDEVVFKPRMQFIGAEKDIINFVEKVFSRSTELWKEIKIIFKPIHIVKQKNRDKLIELTLKWDPLKK